MMDRSSWLIQRLTQPRGHDNPFSFGGGRVNGGLTDDAMDLLRGIFSFDYMGAAEFEFGAVPKAFEAMAKKAEKMTATSFEISLADVAPDFRDDRPAPEGSAAIYVLCDSADREEVETRIRGWSGVGYNSDLKESTRLSSSLRPFQEWDGEVMGWLELNNAFMFFTDEEMWRKTSSLFGVETPEAIASEGERS